jgi:hypothetical protein
LTLVSEIIQDAYRQSNIQALGVAVTAAQSAEALRYLNRLVRSVFGNEVGENLEPLPIGRTGIDRPSGYPYYDQTPAGDWFVPKNRRLMLNLSAPLTVYLHPRPDDGSRFAVIDASNNLATYNLIIDGNGRNIETTPTVTLNTNGTAREWFYREDQANWVKTSSLITTDVFPFPEEFDDYFVTMLAIRLNPAYGVALDNQNQFLMNRALRQLRARYSQSIETSSETALIRMPRSARDRDAYRSWDSDSDATTRFNTGYPW